MRLLLAALLVATMMSAGQEKPAEHAAPAPAPPAAPSALSPREVVEKLFEAMAARDAVAAKDLFAADAVLFSLSKTGKAIKMPLEDFLNAIGSGKAVWKERVWDVEVREHGYIATVWAAYDFHNNRIFSHCGQDSFSLMRTAAGWKITYISDTRETEGCVNPLGPVGR